MVETIIIVLVTLIFGLILFNLINNKKFAIFSFLILLSIGGYYFMKVKFNDYYLQLFAKIDNIEMYVLIFGIIGLLVGIVEYIFASKKINEEKPQEDRIDYPKVAINEEKVEDSNLLIYLEMMDEPLACLVDNYFLINNKMKKNLQYNNYVIEKKKFYNYVLASDKNGFMENNQNSVFRLKVNGENEWYESFCSDIENKKYCLIRKSTNLSQNKVQIKTFKELNNYLSEYSVENKDYYLVFFKINNYKQLLSFYGKDFVNLVVSKHLNNLNDLAYINEFNIFYISPNEYVILLKNNIEYNIFLSELESGASIVLKDNISMLDNKVIIQSKIGAIASINLKDKSNANVIKKGFEMLELACEDDYNGDYAIFHEIDEDFDYSIRDLNIDLDFDLNKYKKRIQ